MSKFTDELKIELGNRKQNRIKLLENLEWEIGSIGSGNFIVVPKGFICDGVSVPRAFWWYIPPVGHPAVRGAVLHDYLLNEWKAGNLKETKKYCDKQFKEALIACGVRKTTANIAYYAVRIWSLIKYRE